MFASTSRLAIGILLFALSTTLRAQSAQAPLVIDGVLHDDGKTPEVSTSELRKALTTGSAVVLDARPYDEFAVSHIPGARSVPAKAGTAGALYTADANAITSSIPDKAQPLILYCNGLYCGRSKRFAEDLTKSGFSNVRRYQLGAPGWRALGGVMQVEKDALVRLLSKDGTAVLVDGRDAQGPSSRLRGAIWIPLNETSKAKDDGRLPMTDHNTRIFVVADSAEKARAVGEAIVHDAFHNVAYFAGSVTDLPELTAQEPSAATGMVLFVCEHGNVKSLMAANYFNELAKARHLPYRATSRGTAPDSTTVPPAIVAGLRGDGFEVSQFHPTAIAKADVASADRVILINTDLPADMAGVSSQTESWSDVPPASVDYAAAREALKAHVLAVIEELSAHR